MARGMQGQIFERLQREGCRVSPGGFEPKAGQAAAKDRFDAPSSPPFIESAMEAGAVRLVDSWQMNVGRILCQRARLALNRISPAWLGQPSLVSLRLPGLAQIFNEQDRRCGHMNNAKSDNERQPSGRGQTGCPQAHGAAGTSHDDKHDVSYCSTRRPFREPCNFGMGIADSDNQQRGSNERPSHRLFELSGGNAADSHSLPRVVISK